MKKIILGLAFMLAIAGCSSTTQPTVTVTETVVSQPTENAVSVDDAYVAVLRQTGNGVLNSLSSTDLIDLGKQVCKILDSGVSINSLANALVQELSSDGTESVQAAGAIVGAAVPTYCPSHQAELEAFVNNNSY